MTATITNGTIKFEQNVKTGDFESKKSSVELSFTIAEGSDADAAIESVARKAKSHNDKLLGFAVADTVAKPAAASAVPKPDKAAKAPKVPSQAKAALADPADVEDVIEQNSAAASDDDDLSALLGTGTTEITDKELMDATQKCQLATKNGSAIKQEIKNTGITVPPGRVIDIPQDKRQQYLDALKVIAPKA